MKKQKPNAEDYFDMNGQPRQNCHKCGKHYWSYTVAPKTWSCVYCGNLIYFNYGAFKQQIDLVMESHRGEDYVKSTDKTKIYPKLNEEIKRIKFSEKRKQKQEGI
jgi:ribosomal protein L37AE/L43A